MIPKQFYRVWGGYKPIPDLHAKWWDELQEMHPTYTFHTLRNFDEVEVPDSFQFALGHCKSWAGYSDILSMLAMYQFGGVYVDTDVMPLKPFDPLVQQDRPFLGRRSSKSFECAVMGSPKMHPAFRECIREFPNWYWKNQDRSNSISTGPGFFSHVLFGRPDVLHLPPETFYPYNGFGAPKREEKLKIFGDKNNFPPQMIAAHFSNHRWGGKPNKR